MTRHEASGSNRPRGRLAGRWVIPGAGFLLALMGGISYAWGSFVVPLRETYGWTTAQATLPFTVFMVVFALGMVPAGRLQDRYGPRRVAATGAGVFLLAYSLASLVHRVPHPLWLVATYGILGGVGCALTYACVAPPARKWFPDRPGLAISMAVAGFGLAAAVISPLKADRLIPTWGVEGTLLILGCLVSGVSLVAAWLIRNPPPGWVPPVENPSLRSAPRPASVEQTPVEMLRSPVFYLVWATFALVMLGGLLAIGLITPYGKLTLGLSPGRAAWAMSLFALVNGLGRPLAGFLGDRFGSIRVMIGTYVAQTVVFLAFPVFAATASRFYLSAALLGWGYAVTLALFPAVTARSFGVKHLGINYGLVFTAFGFGALGSVGGSWLYDLTGSYTPAFLLAGGTTGLGLGLAVALKVKHRLP